MFGGFREKTHFEVYCKKFDSYPTVKKCKYHKGFTAAFLFVLADLLVRSNSDRQEWFEHSKQAVAFVEKRLSKEELRIFDDSLTLFARIWNGEVMPRGDWCLHNGENDNPFYNLYLCYGDLLWDSEYLNDYESAPILIRGTVEMVDFFKDMWAIQPLMAEYMQLFIKS